MQFQISSLRLVYPPISNQVAEWVKTDVDVEALLRKSNLYMFASREVPKFSNVRWHDAERHLLAVELELGSTRDECLIDFHQISESHCVTEGNALEILAGDFLKPNATKYDVIQLCETDSGGERVKVLDWFTPDKLLFERWRRRPIISGLNRYREFTKFQLQYVGISKASDSFSRVLERAHEKRLAILSNEQQISASARVTDETYLFFFAVSPLSFRVVDTEEDFKKMFSGTQFQPTRNIADAEKAFINVLQAKYNDVRYRNYPKSTDGLYGLGLATYAYVIAEDIQFQTQTTVLRGGYAPDLPCSNDADAIEIEGDSVTLITAEMLADQEAGFRNQ